MSSLLNIHVISKKRFATSFCFYIFQNISSMFRLTWNIFLADLDEENFSS